MMKRRREERMTDTLDILRTDDYLEHHGILGMKWGIRRTPEQLGHKLSRKRERFEEYSSKAKEAGEAGKTKSFKRYQKKSERTYKQQIKLSKALDKALKRQVEEDDEVVKKGSIDDVLAISHRLSEDQINRATKRIKAQQGLEALRPDEMKRVDKLINIGKKVSDVGQTAYNITKNFSDFRDAVRNIPINDIKRENELNKSLKETNELQRKERVSAATKTGDINKMKKVWGEATVAELKDMKETLNYRNQIEALAAKSEKIKDSK